MLASRYTTTTTSTPPTSARGSVRSGATISSAMKLVCCQPPYVNRIGTSAAPMAASAAPAPRATAGAAGITCAAGSGRASSTPAPMSVASASSLSTVRTLTVIAPGVTPT